MTIDERLDALVFTVENMAGLMKGLIEKQDAMETQAEADRQVMQGAILEMREGVAAMLVIGERLGMLVSGLTTAQQGTSQHVDKLEHRVDALENLDAA